MIENEIIGIRAIWSLIGCGLDNSLLVVVMHVAIMLSYCTGTLKFKPKFHMANVSIGHTWRFSFES